MRLDALNRVPMYRVQNLDTNQKALQQQEKTAVCLVPNFYKSKATMASLKEKMTGNHGILKTNCSTNLTDST